MYKYETSRPKRGIEFSLLYQYNNTPSLHFFTYIFYTDLSCTFGFDNINTWVCEYDIHIYDNVQKKMDGWQTKFLSTAGKETLIKAVAYAMPVYSMNCF